MKNSFPKGDEEKFNEYLLEEYFKLGSVDAVFKKHKFSLPISPAQYHRNLKKWGVIKAAGPNSRLSETLMFFSRLKEESDTLKVAYEKMPLSFQTSAQTLYRILSYVKEGVTRRVGTALVISPAKNQRKVLVARDVSIPREHLGKRFGDLTMPVGFSRKRDSSKTSVARILQQEVFTKRLIKGDFPWGLVEEVEEPFMFLDIADIRVSVYHLQLSKELSQKSCFGSFKLEDYKFVDAGKLVNSRSLEKYRAGNREAAAGYIKYLELLNRNLKANPVYKKSIINLELY